MEDGSVSHVLNWDSLKSLLLVQYVYQFGDSFDAASLSIFNTIASTMGKHPLLLQQDPDIASSLTGQVLRNKLYSVKTNTTFQ